MGGISRRTNRSIDIVLAATSKGLQNMDLLLCMDIRIGNLDIQHGSDTGAAEVDQ